MKTSKVIQIISTFNEKEFKEFEKRARQRFYKNEKMKALIDFIAYHFPDFDEETILKENAFKYIYQNGEAFEDIRIRELLSLLNKYVKDFLVLIQAKKSDFYYQLDLLKQYNERGLEKLYQLQLKTLKSQLKNSKFKNNDYHKHNFLLARVENKHFTTKHIRALDQNIQLKLDYLDVFYFSTKLKESCEMLNRQRLLNQKYVFNLFEEIEVLIEKYKNTYLNHPTIICYYEIYKLLMTKDDIEQLDKCVTLLNENQSNFSNEELKTMYDFPQNYCIAHINKGNNKYTKILFKLQNYLLDKSFNMIDGCISQISYRNIVSIALKLQKYEWSEEFIEKYKNKVAPEFRENTYNMNKANLYHSLKDYDKTIKLLNQVEFTDVYYAYYSKVILLKTYYAIKEFETLSYFITAFRLYLKRNKEIPTNYKKGADSFLSNFKKIFNVAEKLEFLATDKINSKLDKAKESISNEKNIHNRAWLLEILEELRK